MSSCIFCRIVRGEAPAYMVYKGRGIAVFLDIFPVDKGHLLVVSEDHYESLADAPPTVALKVLAAASALVRIYRERLGAPGVNLVANSGRYAGQEVFHLHVHVIPRWRRTGWRGLVQRHRLTEEEAREVVESLKPHLSLIEEYLDHVEKSG